MKAVIWTKYGKPDVLLLREIDTPDPQNNEVLIRVHATTVTSGDCEMRSLSGPLWHSLAIRLYAGIRKPERLKILGMEFAGMVESVGKNVHLFQSGDRVFGATGFIAMGTYAEYICLPEKPEDGALAIMPENMTYQEATPVPVGGLEALSFLKMGNLRKGQEVLINGAGGTIGTYAVQLARLFEANITAVDSADKLDMVLELGADSVIDYETNDFVRLDKHYDFILDLASKTEFSKTLKRLTPDGCYLIANPGIKQWLRGKLTTLTHSKEVVFGDVHPCSEDLNYLSHLIEAGKLRTVIDKCFPLEQVQDAHQYVESGRKQGHVIINVAQNILAPTSARIT